MQEGQNCPTDMMMYYDWRPGTVFNGLFDAYTDAPLWSYWALYAWDKLKTLGTQVKASCDAPDVRVTAARGADGKLGILVSRYVLDDNITSVKGVTVSLVGGKFDEKVRAAYRRPSLPTAPTPTKTATPSWRALFCPSFRPIQPNNPPSSN